MFHRFAALLSRPLPRKGMVATGSLVSITPMCPQIHVVCHHVLWVSSSYFRMPACDGCPVGCVGDRWAMPHLQHGMWSVAFGFYPFSMRVQSAGICWLLSPLTPPPRHHRRRPHIWPWHLFFRGARPSGACRRLRRSFARSHIGRVASPPTTISGFASPHALPPPTSRHGCGVCSWFCGFDAREQAPAAAVVAGRLDHLHDQAGEQFTSCTLLSRAEQCGNLLVGWKAKALKNGTIDELAGGTHQIVWQGQVAKQLKHISGDVV